MFCNYYTHIIDLHNCVTLLFEFFWQFFMPYNHFFLFACRTMSINLNRGNWHCCVNELARQSLKRQSGTTRNNRAYQVSSLNFSLSISVIQNIKHLLDKLTLRRRLISLFCVLIGAKPAVSQRHCSRSGSFKSETLKIISCRPVRFATLSYHSDQARLKESHHCDI